MGQRWIRAWLGALIATLLFWVPRLSHSVEGGCSVLNTDGTAAVPKDDALFEVLRQSSSCPLDVFALRNAFARSGSRVAPSLVANHGLANLRARAFVRAMLFEQVLGSGAGTPGKGDVFFGHFLGGGSLDRLEALQEEGLLVEAIAWDGAKGVYNFYELMAESDSPQWFYRGDSTDIGRDLRSLYLTSGVGSNFSLRCSGCHANGGPIMKELAVPHNDWWTVERPVPLDNVELSDSVAAIVDDLVDASELASSVTHGIDRLVASPTYREFRAKLTLQEQLRPLFCPMELNLTSDPNPMTSATDVVSIPADFFVDPRLRVSQAGDADERHVPIQAAHYREALARSQSTFLDSATGDADHGWLAPGKAYSDIAAVDDLVETGVIDEEFVTDVLAVDFTSPVVSQDRCGLLGLVPDAPVVSDGAEGAWREAFEESLAQSSLPAAHELLRNFVDPERNAQAHRERARRLLDACETALASADAVSDLFRLLQQRRAELTGTPLERSLEEGFRTVFPEVQSADFAVEPGTLRLDQACEVLLNDE